MPLSFEPVDLFAAGHVCFINLDKRTDRRDELLSNISSCGIDSPFRIPAVCGSTIPQPAQRTVYFNSNAIGCLLSHEIAIKQAQDLNLPYITILEDDCFLPPDTLEVTAKLMNNVPSGWHILYIGGNHITLPTHSPTNSSIAIRNILSDDARCGPNVRRVCNTLTTHAYTIHNRAYASVLKLLQPPYTKPVDSLLVRYQRVNPCYGLVPSVLTQRDSFSDILQKVALYTPQPHKKSREEKAAVYKSIATKLSALTAAEAAILRAGGKPAEAIFDDYVTLNNALYNPANEFLRQFRTENCILKCDEKNSKAKSSSNKSSSKGGQ